ncbi:MAG TPA: DUF2723 domain-containing protein [Bacteroidales bacterium]|nr:DUF2723 domain-containing protein [Bacteroidales bacterium]
MNFYKRINNLLGGVVFVIASLVYILTSEPTMSFWDCGEYITTAYKLEVGHPPGAPLFQMIGRFFSLFAFGDVTHVARMVNTMTALCSGLTILFLFWSITLIAKKILLSSGEITREKTWMIMGAGLVGALAYTFTDSFWFSAVEGEVYGMSSFFTAVVFWAILKWEEQSEEKHSWRWLLLIAYLIGLSVGVHMLNLLAIPAITFVYYFRKYPKTNWKGFLMALAVSVLLLAVVMYIIIPWIVKLAGLFELFFVNMLGLPFNTGTLFYFLLLTGLIVFGLYYTRKKARTVLNTVILAFMFIVIGYTSFFLLIIRSNANTPLDENNPENAMYLLSYLNREQYGDWPLLNGQYYNAPVVDRKDGNPVYTKDDASGKYLITDKKEKIVPVYDSRFTTIFPRMWSNSDPKHAEDYIRWGDVKGRPVEVTENGKTETRYCPTFGENLTFFWRYQVIHMYYRYFMWNFVGRQNDFQGNGSKIDGNWKSGIRFIDRWRLGSQDIPDARKSKADNSFYFLPLILGLIGFFYNYRKDRRSTWVIFLLFFMTGIAIILYLNQYSPQPRERDYAYAGSFYAFAIWIGLGVMQLSEWLLKIVKPLPAIAIATLGSLILVPGIMAQQGWDDHSRANRYTSLAVAKNYLNTCAPNAILFTNGDNDTFPLWYAQEVEGIRTDVRVVNLSLLSLDWYIDMLKRKAYNSEPVPFSLTWDKYRMGNHDATYIVEDPAVKDYYVNLRDLFNLMNMDERKLKITTQDYGVFDYFPTRKFMVTYDPEKIRQENLVPATYLAKLDTVRWSIKNNVLGKNDLMILDLLAHNDWQRPVYFAMTMEPSTYIYLGDYFHLEGMAFRLLPSKADSKDGQPGDVNTTDMYDHVMNKFYWGNMQDPHVYIDEQNQRMVMNYRNMFGRLAYYLILENKKDSARRVLDRCLEVMPIELGRINFFLLPILDGYYKVGETAKAGRVGEAIYRAMEQDLAYLFSFRGKDLKANDLSLQEDLMTMNQMSKIATENHAGVLAQKSDELFQKYYQEYINRVAPQ